MKYSPLNLQQILSCEQSDRFNTVNRKFRQYALPYENTSHPTFLTIIGAKFITLTIDIKFTGWPKAVRSALIYNLACHSTTSISRLCSEHMS